jgi:hypothetical protein
VLDFETVRDAGGPRPEPDRSGTSRDGRSLPLYRLAPPGGAPGGDEPFRISLIAGCHADEPVGPRLLDRLLRALAALPDEHPARARCDWWIVPHVNPDGAAANAGWAEPLGERVDPVSYVRNVVREAPGDDVEFGFPRDPGDTGARPENRAIDRWWREAGGPFRLHASLHGMAVAHGPWFLVEPAWAERCEPLIRRCRAAVDELGYGLHDVDRGGDKGFVRIGPGFSTRPDSREMIRFFLERGDEATAALFRPSSMEAVRRLGGDPLTLVSEMPLFLLPPRDGSGPATSEDLLAGKARLADWRRRLEAGDDEAAVRADIEATGVVPMPVEDQMRLQWAFVRAGLELAGAPGSPVAGFAPAFRGKESRVAPDRRSEP